MLTDPAAKQRSSHARTRRLGVATAVLLACSPLTAHAQYVASSTSSVQVDTSVLETLGAPQTIADLMLPMASRPTSQRPGAPLSSTGAPPRQGLLPDPRRAPQSELLVSPGKSHTTVAQTHKPHKPSVAVTIPAPPPQQASYTPPADVPATADAGQAEATAQARAIAAAKQELAERDRIAKADQIAAQRTAEAQEQHLKEQQAKEQAAKEQLAREAELKAAADAEAEAQAKAAQEQAAAQAEASRKAEEQAAEQARQAQQAAKARADAEAREAQAQAEAEASRRAAEQAAAEQAARKAQSARETAVAALPSAPIVPSLPSAAPAKASSTPAPAYSSGENLTIPFASNAADIPAQSGSALESIVQKLNSNPELSARIQAYAAGDDSSVSKARRLSLSRALAIRSYLLDRGIAPTRIEVRALGTPTRGNPDRVDVEMVKS
ncbi:OmpA family protein [Insolitispirillum peregrinum]|uniref:OmpA family protein n=1 Tax=Insolitispirillum peregrinum TaxID=80876 RepID=A0A1N7IXY9_9PROT|nr:OmpA family protein [Insolitispirillum peregrinum]SIS41929.1 OmpA family protein [Insolitispirillum peregrinum]